MHVHVIALIVMLLGLVAYCISPHAKGAEVGRLMFFAGLLVLLMASSSPVFHLVDRAG